MIKTALLAAAAVTTIAGFAAPAQARGAFGPANFETTCFFNGNGEACRVVDTGNGLQVTYKADGKTVFYYTPAGTVNGAKPTRVVDGANTYYAQGDMVRFGAGPAWQFNTQNGTTMIPMFVR